MEDKLNYIVTTARSLIEESPSGWRGDINDFVTASAGSLNEEDGEYLTTRDLKIYAEAQRYGEVPSDYDWISCEVWTEYADDGDGFSQEQSTIELKPWFSDD